MDGESFLVVEQMQMGCLYWSPKTIKNLYAHRKGMLKSELSPGRKDGQKKYE